MIGSLASRLVVLLVVASWPMIAADSVPGKVVTVGVLASEGGRATQERWQATVAYLAETVQGHRFVLRPLAFGEIDKAVSERTVDFLLADPGVYAGNSRRHGVSRIATFKNSVADRPCATFGSVVFRKTGERGATDLAWLRGRRVAAVARESLGGWILAWREFVEEGINPETDLSVSFFGTHEAVVEAVLHGAANAGVVRTGVLEGMAAAGALDLATVETLAGNAGPRTPGNSDFPLLLSTPLYPEWPMARLAHVPDRLAEQVAAALLAMPEEHPAATCSGGRGWAIANDYRAVDVLLAALGVDPYSAGRGIGAGDVISRYWPYATAVAVLLVAIAAMLVYMAGLNHRLRSSEARMRELAMHDGLTALPNRKMFAEVSDKAIANAARHGTLLSVLYLDLDGFKPVNDTFGHAIGDLVLQDVAERLRQCIRKGDVVARVGGDEFTVLLDSIRGRDGVRRVMARILRVVGERYGIHGVEVEVGCSIGAALFPDDGVEVQELLHRADIALAGAKAAGKGCGRFFDEIPSRE